MVEMTHQQTSVLVTGANRGIGFECVRHYVQQGWQVIAAVRTPDRAEALRALADEHDTITIEKLDVASDQSIDALAAKLSGQPIDVLINNAGIFGEFTEQAFGSINFARFDTFMRTNVLGPLKMCEAFVPHVRAGQLKKIVSITSQAGSFGLDSGGLPGMYFYKSSKAAQNMVMRNVAKDLKAHGIVVCILSPGMVNTAGEIPPERRFQGLIEPPESIAGMIAVIDRLTMDDTGKFVRYSGEPQPW
ncbi:MAG: SDR family oxidoreductase [Gammaproteobacteria bacterium]|nr:SDR family oxidoreductase [Gammaproteobacteria bacterium]